MKALIGLIGGGDEISSCAGWCRRIFNNQMFRNLIPGAVGMAAAVLLLTGCIEDGLETSPSSQPVFSVESVNLGKVFTAQPTMTSRLMVYNRHNKVLNISHISLRSGAGVFRINVDGAAGSEFRDVEIRPNDSIYVLVNATLSENGHPGLAKVTDYIDFETNGVTTSVPVTAEGEDVVRKRAETLTSDTRWDATYPYQLFDSIVVAKGATLTLPAGAKLYFHDKAYLRVKGRLVTEGTVGEPVVITGDRLGNVVGDIPFDLMASQWEGMKFDAGSRGNTLSHTVISNTVNGVELMEGSEVEMVNCRLRNAAGYPLNGRGGNIRLIGCEVADGGAGAMLSTRCAVTANHCTFANYYLFSAPVAPAVLLGWEDSRNFSREGKRMFNFDNCIFYGMGRDVLLAEGVDKFSLFRNCLFKSQGTDDEYFVNCLWDSDPMFGTVRSEYKFDYRLLPGSPAIGTADPSLTLPEAQYDMYGTPRGITPSIGAYQFAIDN